MPKEYKNKVKKNSTGKIKSSPKNLKQDNILKKKGGAGKAEEKFFDKFYMKHEEKYIEKYKSCTEEDMKTEWEEKKDKLLKLSESEKKELVFERIHDLLDIMWNANKKTTPKDDYYIVYRKAIFYELLSLIDKIITNYGDERFTNEQENTNEVKHLLDLFQVPYIKTLFIHLMYISYLLTKLLIRESRYFIFHTSPNSIFQSNVENIKGLIYYRKSAQKYRNEINFTSPIFTNVENDIFAILVQLQNLKLDELSMKADREQAQKSLAKLKTDNHDNVVSTNLDSQDDYASVDLVDADDAEVNPDVPDDRDDKSETLDTISEGDEADDKDGGGNKKIKKNKRIIKKKEVLGKLRCIYKLDGDRKEYIKYKGILIHVKEYKEKMKKNKSTKGSK